MGKLKVKDNWGRLTYTYEKPDGTEEPFDPDKSGKCFVQWGDKSVERVSFKPVKHVESVSDWGHTEDVPQVIPTVYFTIRGTEFTRRLANFSGVYDIVYDKS